MYISTLGKNQQKYDLKSKSIIMFIIMISNQNQKIVIKINLKSY